MAAAKKLNVGIVVNRSKPGAKEVLNQLLEFSHGHPNLHLLFEKRTAAMLDQTGLTEAELARKSNLLLVAGGDGSLIDVVDAIYPQQVPILGVNIGSLGFSPRYLKRKWKAPFLTLRATICDSAHGWYWKRSFIMPRGGSNESPAR